MRAETTFGIDFLIRKCKADKSRADLFARITVDGNRKEIGLKEQIAVTDWDPKREIVNGSSKQVKAVNARIEDVRFRIKEVYRKLDDKGQIITADAIKNIYNGVQTTLKGHTLKYLLDYYKKIWEPKLKNGGFKNYKTTIAYAELFVAKAYPTSRDVFLSQIDGQFATEFEHFIRTTPIKDYDPCKGNGVGKHIQRFKRILNWAADDLKWLPLNPIAKYSCPLKKNKRKKLNLRELLTLEKKSFVNETLAYIRELFLYSCYTGLAFADAMALQDSDFDWDLDGTVWCKIYRTKSQELCAVPLLQSAQLILNKYRQESKLAERKSIFRPITNQYVNERLKVIQEICEIETPLTFHVARHSFAKTVALKNGVPLETVQMMMGHTKISTTLIYADIDEEKILQDTSGLETKLAQKRGALFH